jgi:hypothetical protein
MSTHIEVIDHLPVEVDDQRWADDRRGYTAEIRLQRQAVQIPESEATEAMPDFDEEFGDD